MNTTSVTKGRIFSIDVLRGFDMLLLLYGSVIAWSLKDVSWWPQWMLTQFSHPWGVFTLFDVIQPLFAFICGAGVPLALSRRMQDGRAGWAYWRHVLWRFVELNFLGAVCSGLLRFDRAGAPWFGNTLQLLAFGYLFAALCYAYVPRRLWLAIGAALLAGWGVALSLGGDFTPDGNLSAKVERFMTALLVPGKTLEHVTYTSWATIPMFAALTLLGAYALGFLRDASRSEGRRTALLLSAGAAVSAAGVVLHFVQPQIKHIYTPSYTLITAGICLALLGAFYWIFDVRGVRKGTWLMVLYGRASLASYMFWGLFGGAMKQASQNMLGGIEKLLLPASYHTFVTTCGTLFLSTSLLWLWSVARRRS